MIYYRVSTAAEVSARLKAARLERKLLQKNVAADLGVPAVTLRGWEEGKSLPRREHWQAIANYYQIDPYDLFI